MVMGFRTMHGNQKGFTLIEVMLAMVITAIIVPALVMSISQMFTSSAASASRMQVVKQVENALHYINRDAEMTWPSEVSTATNASFTTTSLSSATAVNATSLPVASTSGFPSSGTVAIGTGTSIEILKYQSVSSGSITLTAGVKTARTHSAGDPVCNALAFKWTDSNNTVHTVSYGKVTFNGSNFLQRSEIIGSTSPTSLKVAGYINAAAGASNFSFDGQQVTVQITSAVDGARPASETRTLKVQPRTTN
jgi:prepilin-type N-terminal cleavage/methylation domain-containing protein